MTTMANSGTSTPDSMPPLASASDSEEELCFGQDALSESSNDSDEEFPFLQSMDKEAQQRFIAWMTQALASMRRNGGNLHVAAPCSSFPKALQRYVLSEPDPEMAPFINSDIDYDSDQPEAEFSDFGGDDQPETEPIRRRLKTIIEDKWLIEDVDCLPDDQQLMLDWLHTTQV